MKPLLIVDGYNIIGAWAEAERQEWPQDECRDRLVHQLEDYAGYADERIVIVFDGYQSDRLLRSEEQRGSVSVVFTRHGETADSYIERLVAETPRYVPVRVATSDRLEQSQVLGSGAVRLTARELLRELRQTRSAGLPHGEAAPGLSRKPLEQRLPQDVREKLEQMRRQ